VSAHLATVALLLLTLGGVYVTFVQQRLNDDRPAAGSASTSNFAEVLLDTTVDALPAGHVLVAVDRWQFQPGPDALIGPGFSGPTLVVVETGSLVLTIHGVEQTVKAGDFALVPPGREHALHNPGTVDTFAAILVFDESQDTNKWYAGTPLITSASVISSTSDALPVGRVRLRLDRLTVPPDTTLPAYEATDFDWFGIYAGRLGLTLVGEKLPFRWISGQEHVIGSQQPLPIIRAGWQVTLRNAGDVPLVLYRLKIVPVDTPGPASEEVAPSAPG
jgi:hypothetical protein